MSEHDERRTGPVPFMEKWTDKDELKRKFDMSAFGANAVIRGMQLTFVGAHRALQNPSIFTNDHYKQALVAVALGLGIRLVFYLPVFGLRALFWVVSIFSFQKSDEFNGKMEHGLGFIEEYVLQVPFFLMALLRYIDPTLDDLFMQSLRWVDATYIQKHKKDDPNQLRGLYYPSLSQYRSGVAAGKKEQSKSRVIRFISRFARKGLISLFVFTCSYIPYFGRFVLPAASFYTTKKAIGIGPSTLVFSTGLFIPRRYLVVFLQTYFASRSLMRELLEPYFARVQFTKDQKKRWFRSREGVLFGFSLGFYLLIKVPFLGVLIYGIAEASTAYLLTKITDPPPPPTPAMSSSEGLKKYTEEQQLWKNRHEFLNLSLSNIDHSGEQ